MLHRDAAAFATDLPARGGLLGLDPGEKRIGVAASDPDRRLASPIDTIARTRFAADAARIMALFESRACVGVVIGLPLNMDGTAGPAAQSARAFANNLLKVRAVPMLLWDERLTTAAVTRAMIEQDVTRAKRAARVDQEAAAYLLQGVLDALARLERD
jgi:putative Holliday junction resolvase